MCWFVTSCGLIPFVNFVIHRVAEFRDSVLNLDLFQLLFPTQELFDCSKI